MSFPHWHRRANRSLTACNRWRSATWAPPPRWRPALEALEGRLLPSTYTVTNTDDTGPGSLRQAILDSNGASGTSTIAFDIAGAGVHTVQPTSPLPAVTGMVIIDGTTEPGYAGVPLIELNGSAAGANAVGLMIKGGNSTVKGLIVNAFAMAGIELTMGSTNTITGSYLGTDTTGTVALGNGDGLLLSFSSNNLIGGTTAALRNLIAGNHGSGIHITSDALTRGNLIEGNYLGTDISATRSLGNRTGVELDEANNTVGGTAAGAGNVISGNDIGVAINSSGNVVQGNYIGTDVTGTIPLSNRIGVAIESYPAQQVLIGGTTAAARNLISGNSYAGVEITGPNVAFNTVEGNYIGTDVTGSRALGNGYGVYIAFGASSNLIGGTTAGAGNLISGNATGVTVLSSSSNKIQGNLIGTNAAGTAAVGNVDGVDLLSGASNVVGGTASGTTNVISGNFNIGVLLAAGSNQVQGNRIGVNTAGSAALPNTEGVYVSGPNNLIGGTASGAGNVISGNTSAGVDLSGTFATGNLVQGDRIGTDLAGTRAVPNGQGVTVSGATNTIGGTAAGARNVISGNAGLAVSLFGDNNVVQANYIGIDALGTAALGNQGAGVGVSGRGEVIGGTTAAARNVISGNLIGLSLGGRNTQVEGNYIGTDATGTRAVGNALYGVSYGHGASLVTIGGDVPGAGNVISGNAFYGVYVIAENARLEGNLIGTDATGTVALGNGQSGIYLSSGFGDMIGGTTPAARNVISGNQVSGIEVFTTNDVILGNYIGTDATGTLAVGNLGAGVLIHGPTTGNVIGGTAPGAGNLISGNTGAGVSILSANSVSVEGNYIGTDTTGTRALANQTGVQLSGGVCTIGGTALGAGNLISGNRGSGVEIINSSGLNLVQGNEIGTDITGTLALANGVGVQIDASAFQNTVGGTAAGARNLISGNTGAGLAMLGSSNVVLGNFIGTDPAGQLGLPNAVGVSISGNNNQVGGTTAGAGNVISGNRQDGVQISGSTANVIQGNFIGTDVTGQHGLGNGAAGVVLHNGARDTTIGGTTSGARNVISGDRADGVHLTDPGTSDNLVEGNYIGTDVTGTLTLANGNNGVRIDDGSRGNIIGAGDDSNNAGAGNVISGNFFSGVYIAGAGTDQNVVAGNLIGTDRTGTAVVPNNLVGVFILEGAQANRVGTDGDGVGDAAERNVISGNILSGVLIEQLGTDQNVVAGNYIGTDLTGTVALGNEQDGVFIAQAAKHNRVGVNDRDPDFAAERNVISGNWHGVEISGLGTDQNVVAGNYIGTDVTGTRALGNSHFGVGVDSHAQGNRIGTNADGVNDAAERNLISGNVESGVVLAGDALDQTVVAGNFIGTDVTGMNPLGNGGDGVRIADDSLTTIGGTAASAGNLISGNLGNGVFVYGNANLIEGNQIGTDTSGTQPLSNGGNGVLIAAGSGNTVGGTVAGAANTIAFSGNDGVRVDTSTGDAIRRNAIFASGNLGIELINNGNHNQAYPVLSSAMSDRTSTTITGTLASAASTTYTMEFFADTVCNPSGYGEGERFLGSTTVTTNASGNASFTFTVAIPVQPGQLISATATDPVGDTSQFSACAPVTGPGARGVVPLGLTLPATTGGEGDGSLPGLAGPSPGALSLSVVADSSAFGSAGLDQSFTAIVWGTGTPFQTPSESAPPTLPDERSADAGATDATAGLEGLPFGGEEYLWTW